MQASQESPPDPLARQPARVAIPQLVEEHGGRLHRMSLKLCGHPDDADDLVQDVFLTAFRKWDQFQGDAHPTTWLYTIAARACARRRRKRSGEPRRMESFDELLPSGAERIPDPEVLEGPLEEHLRREAQDAVEGAIARLPPHFRVPLVLKEIVELPIADVAAILGLKEATVKTRLHRARLLLRRELARTLPETLAPAPDHSRQMCLDLLKAKQDALDRGVAFEVPAEDLCLRCRSMFDTLDLGQEICGLLGQGEMPSALKQALDEKLSGQLS